MIEAKKFSEQEFVYNFYRYKNQEKNKVKTFSQLLNFSEKSKKQKFSVLPKYFSIEQDRKIRFLLKNFKEKPIQNFPPLIKSFSFFIIQNNSFLLKSFIKINDSIFLELLKIFNFYSALSLRAMIETYFALYIYPYLIAANQVKISSKYYLDEVKNKWK